MYLYDMGRITCDDEGRVAGVDGRDEEQTTRVLRNNKVSQ